MNNEVDNKILEIKEFIGLVLTPCDLLTGIQNHNGKKYFNVMLDKPCFASIEYEKLLRLKETSNLISNVEPNGNKRLAIFFN